MRISTYSWALALLLLGGCKGSAGDTEEGAQEGAQTETQAGQDGAPPACSVEGPAPQTGVELLARIEALPRPVTLACLLISLPRPLSVVATDSTFSVQPAVGRESPRIFVINEGLALSIALAGEGQELLEFGEWRSSTQTIKGELAFPLAEAATAEQAFVQAEGISTRCAHCHRNEEPVPDFPAFFSDAIRPRPESLLELSELESLRAGCGDEGGGQRCELLRAIFDHGSVVEGSFDEDIPTFF